MSSAIIVRKAALRATTKEFQTLLTLKNMMYFSSSTSCQCLLLEKEEPWELSWRNCLKTRGNDDIELIHCSTIPKECSKFANIIKNLLQGSSIGGEELQSKVTIMILREFFATGVIENDLIFQELTMGRIKDIKQIEGMGHI